MISPASLTGFEDVPRLAPLQFAHAMTHCGPCQHYHAIWPYLRMSKVIGGVEADEPYLQPLLQHLLTQGTRNILLAGSADSGVAALVHRASIRAECAPALTVLDRCATPLMTCHTHAQQQGLSIDSIEDNLSTLSIQSAYDLIIGHSVLPFFKEAERPAVLARLANALQPGGHLLLTVRVVPAHLSGKDQRQSPEVMANRVTQALDAISIQLPCPAPEFQTLIREFYLQQTFQVSSYTDRQTLVRELESVGLEPIETFALGQGYNYMTGDAAQRPMGWAYLARRPLTVKQVTL